MKKKNLIALSLSILASFLSFGTAFAQNITDMAVMNDEGSASLRVVQGDSSTVDDRVFLHPDRIRFDNRCIQIDGKDIFLLSGTFHYFRCPQPLWRDRLQKLKDCGFNCVETYVPWNWHERQMPESLSDMSKIDMKPLESFLKLCEEIGLYVIVRPGPYICAEWSGGGFPQWLMQKRPAKTKYEVWLQSSDPVFMQWSEHWYKAVCKVVRKHQIFNRRREQTGVVFFQIENEYNRVKWFPKSEKRKYLERLATVARSNGIEVPLLTCWTSEARNVKAGVLNGVVDMVNSYPRWQIEKGFGRLINQQLKSQPGKPLISGELQGGWYSGVGGKLSADQDGVAAVQTQNILLYALQRGFCAINFYMAAGGTNFDDWAARDITTTYDFAAAVSEDGTLTERYYRLKNLSPLLKEHAIHITRAKESYPAYETTDTLVQLALRRADNGDRYYFIRTEERYHSHNGIIKTDGLSIPFNLEPFGSMVYCVKAGEKTGSWLTRPFEQKTPMHQHRLVSVRHHTIIQDILPEKWHRLENGATIDRQGIFGRHFIYYKVKAEAGHSIQVARLGKNIVNGTSGDVVSASVDGKILPIERETADSVIFNVPASSHVGAKTIIILYEDKGLHHHTNRQVEAHWGVGSTGITVDGKAVPVEFAYTEAERGMALSRASVRPAAIHSNKSRGANFANLLQWHIYTIGSLSDDSAHYFLLPQLGDGFVYFNGHCIGRCWKEGPQREFYLPECWFNPDGKNIIAVSVRNEVTGSRIYTNNSERSGVLHTIATEEWAKESYNKIKSKIDKIISYQQKDSLWLVSRLAMYWKDGAHYTQCWVKNQRWNHGEGDAPVPTVRMPGMRTWNQYKNVPLEQRKPYNETGDMLGVSRIDNNGKQVMIPYQESGHMVTQNNTEILQLAEQSAFLYWLTQDEEYGHLAASVFNTWLLGTYYMNPILDPDQSEGSKGAFAPGGICGYYDYEQIHDWLGMHAALIYDMAHDYITGHPHPQLSLTGKTTDELFDIVMKRFIDIGMVRGGKSGNWNVNGWNVMLIPIMMLKDNHSYADGHGKEYYLNFFLKESTPYHDALPDIMKHYDTKTGLWPESPGYAFGTVNVLTNIAIILRRQGIDIFNPNSQTCPAGTVSLQKAALAMIPWIDPRGNIIVFGDYRGGAADYGILENLLTYYSDIKDSVNACIISTQIQNGMAKGAYSRDHAAWYNICNFAALASRGNEGQYNTSYSSFHRLLTMKNEKSGMMAVLYGGRKGSHLSPNGLALQLYGDGYAIVPDAAGYESYWSKDYDYHQSATGSNTIIPGYTDGDIIVNALQSDFLDVTAGEKRRQVKMVPLGQGKGFYVDVFRSDMTDNDYLMHCVGTSLTLTDSKDHQLPLSPMTVARKNVKGYDWFRNVKGIAYYKPFRAMWHITDSMSMNLWMGGSKGREIMTADAPYTTLNKGITPRDVSVAPAKTPALIVRQTKKNAWKYPFVAVIEPFKNECQVVNVEFLKITDSVVKLKVFLKDGRALPIVISM